MSLSPEDIAKLIAEMKHSPVHQYVVPGLTSSLVGGGDHGSVRLFESDRATREWVTPHSHRFNFTCLVLEGVIQNILFVPVASQGGRSTSSNAYAKGILRPVGGGLGQYEAHRTGEWSEYEEVTHAYIAGSSYAMTSDQIHSIRFSRGAKVLFFEGPNVSDTSIFLEPYSNGKVVETFATHPWMFEREKP